LSARKAKSPILYAREEKMAGLWASAGAQDLGFSERFHKVQGFYPTSFHLGLFSLLKFG